MKSKDNPYKWDSDQPRHFVPRTALLERVQDRLQNGGSCYLVGCRGMGKSAFIGRLIRSPQPPDTELLHFPSPASTRTVARAIQSIHDAMDRQLTLRNIRSATCDKLRQHAQREQLRDLFDCYLSELEKIDSRIERLMLVIDELDQYAEPNDSTGTPWGKPFINELEDIRKHWDGRIVILAAGGLSLVALDSVLGSPFFSRAKAEVLEPFAFVELKELAKPFRDRCVARLDDLVDAVRLSSGGNPAIATYIFQQLWSLPAPTPEDVLIAIDKFRHEEDLLDHIKSSIFASSASSDISRVWPELQKGGGKLTRRRLLELLKPSEAHGIEKEKWVFRMLRSSGLIRATDNAYAQRDIQVEIIPSVLTLEGEPAPEEPQASASTLRQQLVADLSDVLMRIHRMSIDFFSGNDVVPEAVFSATVALGLELRGWRVDREAQSAAGRTDIKARYDSFGDTVAIVEVKIWPRNDYKDLHEQVMSYWSPGVEALATVMVGAVQDEDWPQQFVKECLDGKTADRQQQMDAPASLAAHFKAKTKGPCAVEEVDHLLLRLAKRKKR